MPEHKHHILSSGTLADELVSHASRQGVQIDVVPFFQVGYLDDKELNDTISTLAEENRTVIFTSKQAVRAVVSRLNKVPDWKIYCISQATRKEVVAFWGDTAIIGEADNGEGLALKIVKAKPQEELVFFCGIQRMNALPRMLSEQQIALKEVVVYTTSPIPVTLTVNYDAVFFYNPIGVHSFFSHNKSSKAVLFSIGETTSDAIRSYVGDESTIITIAQPSKELMVDQAISYFKTVKEHGNGI